MGVSGGRRVRRALGVLAVGGALAATAVAQNTTVTASALKMGGQPVTIGQVGFLPVDATGRSVPFSSAGLNAPLAYACNVVNGAIGQPCVVPDSTLTNPANVCYNVQIAGTAPGFSGRQIYTLPQVCISGASWALDAYVPPAQTTNMQPLQQGSGAAAPSGSCNTSAVYEQLGTANAWWFCNAGTWVQASGSGGGSSITFPSGLLYGSNSTSAPSAATPLQIQNAIGVGVYDVSGAAAAATASALQKASNLSDLQSASTARMNIGVGKVLSLSTVSGATQVASIARGVSAVGYADSIAAVNTALSSGIAKLVVDGKFGVGGTIQWPSGVEIECPPGSGFIMLPASNATMLMNKTQVATPNACAAITPNGSTGGFLISNQCDKDLVMRGCILNANSTEAVTGTDHKVAPGGTINLTAVQMLGVDRIEMHGTKVYDSPSYAYVMSNVTNAVLDHADCDGRAASGSPLGPNTDCYHFNGPVDTVDAFGGTLGPNGDDCISLTADDWFSPGTTVPSEGATTHFPGFSQGPITNFRAHNIHLNNCALGYRLLSANNAISNVNFDQIDGTVAGQMGHIDHFSNTGTCSVSNTTIETQNVTAGSPASVSCQSTSQLVLRTDSTIDSGAAQVVAAYTNSHPAGISVLYKCTAAGCHDNYLLVDPFAHVSWYDNTYGGYSWSAGLTDSSQHGFFGVGSNECLGHFGGAIASSSTTPDTCLWRVSAGHFALGNGTAGDSSGGLDIGSINFHHNAVNADGLVIYDDGTYKHKISIAPFEMRHMLTTDGVTQVTYGHGNYDGSGFVLDMSVDQNGFVNPRVGVGGGPATQPTGTCPEVGWAFSQDGHISYCPSAGGTWVSKI